MMYSWLGFLKGMIQRAWEVEEVLGFALHLHLLTNTVISHIHHSYEQVCSRVMRNERH